MQDPGASPQTPPEDLSSGHLSVLLLFTQRVKSKRTEEVRKLSPAADAESCSPLRERVYSEPRQP